MDKEDDGCRSFCLVCRYLTGDKDQNVTLGRDKRLRLESTCVNCDTSKSRFISGLDAVRFKDQSSSNTDSSYRVAWEKQFHLGLQIRKKLEVQYRMDFDN